MHRLYRLLAQWLYGTSIHYFINELEDEREVRFDSVPLSTYATLVPSLNECLGEWGDPR